LGQELAALGIAPNFSAVWSPANTALTFPFRVTDSFTSSIAWVLNGSSVTGHFDIGVYDENWVRKGHTGSITQTGTTTVQTTSFALTLSRGRYYLALVADAGGAYAFMQSTAVRLRGLDVHQMASAFALPDPFVPAVIGVTSVPIFGLASHAL
jgi:hypothetical protein